MSSPTTTRGGEHRQSSTVHPELFKIPWLNTTVPSYGVMLVIGFLGGTWWMTRRAGRVKADPDIVLNLAFIVLFFSMLGARAFYVVHYWESQFADRPGQILDLRAGGFEFYGGLAGAFVPAVLYLWYKGLSIRLYADLVTPSLLFGLGIGRIGCFLFGCCWGGSCPPGLPWAVRFPYGSPPHQRQWEHRLATLPAELVFIDPVGLAAPVPRRILALTAENMAKLRTRLAEAATAAADAKAEGDPERIEKAQADSARLQRAAGLLLDHLARFDAMPASLGELAARPAFRTGPLHPAQIYALIGALLLAWLTNACFYRRKRHGTVMVLGLMLYAVERFVAEVIRVDNPRDTFGLTISQGISIALFLTALVSLLVLRRLPLRSPKPAACAARPEPPQPEPLEPEPGAQATG